MTIAGTASGHIVRAQANGVDATAAVDGDGSFSLEMPLQDGRNQIVIACGDGSLETTITRLVTMDRVAPRLTSAVARRIVFSTSSRRAKSIARVGLSEEGPLVAVITDTSGRWLRILNRSWVKPGSRTIKWNGRLKRGRFARPGVYRLLVRTRDRSGNFATRRTWFRMSVTNDRAARVVRTALRLRGVRYRWGGTSPAGFDCSGLVGYAYRQNGISLPRTSRQMGRAGTAVPRRGLRPADILLFRTSGGGISHAGLYVGGGRFVHASSSRGSVCLSSLTGYYRSRLVGIRRIVR